MKLLFSTPFNLVFFNTMWLLCVIGRDQLLWLSAPLFITYAFLLLGAGKIQVAQLLIPATIGLLADSAMVLGGLLDFNSQLLLPLWLVLLWINFSITLSLALEWLEKHFWLCALAGAIAFPLNYSIGEQLGAVTYTAPYPLVLTLMAAAWAIGLPLLYRVRTFDQRSSKPFGTNSAQPEIESP